MSSVSTAVRQGPRVVSARFDQRPAGQKGPRCRVVVSGVGNRELDVTGNLTGAIAHALFQARGGDSASNWVEAERILDQLCGMSQGPISAAVNEAADGHSTPEAEIVVGGKRRLNRR